MIFVSQMQLFMFSFQFKLYNILATQILPSGIFCNQIFVVDYKSNVSFILTEILCPRVIIVHQTNEDNMLLRVIYQAQDISVKIRGVLY